MKSSPSNQSRILNPKEFREIVYGVPKSYHGSTGVTQPTTVRSVTFVRSKAEQLELEKLK